MIWKDTNKEYEAAASPRYGLGYGTASHSRNHNKMTDYNPHFIGSISLILVHTTALRHFASSLKFNSIHSRYIHLSIHPSVALKFLTFTECNTLSMQSLQRALLVFQWQKRGDHIAKNGIENKSFKS